MVNSTVWSNMMGTFIGNRWNIVTFFSYQRSSYWRLDKISLCHYICIDFCQHRHQGEEMKNSLDTYIAKTRPCSSEGFRKLMFSILKQNSQDSEMRRNDLWITESYNLLGSLEKQTFHKHIALKLLKVERIGGNSSVMKSSPESGFDAEPSPTTGVHTCIQTNPKTLTLTLTLIYVDLINMVSKNLAFSNIMLRTHYFIHKMSGEIKSLAIFFLPILLNVAITW